MRPLYSAPNFLHCYTFTFLHFHIFAFLHSYIFTLFKHKKVWCGRYTQRQTFFSSLCWNASLLHLQGWARQTPIQILVECNRLRCNSMWVLSTHCGRCINGKWMHCCAFHQLLPRFNLNLNFEFQINIKLMANECIAVHSINCSTTSSTLYYYCCCWTMVVNRWNEAHQ